MIQFNQLDKKIKGSLRYTESIALRRETQTVMQSEGC